MGRVNLAQGPPQEEKSPPHPAVGFVEGLGLSEALSPLAVHQQPKGGPGGMPAEARADGSLLLHGGPSNSQLRKGLHPPAASSFWVRPEEVGDERVCRLLADEKVNFLRGEKKRTAGGQRGALPSS